MADRAEVPPLDTDQPRADQSDTVRLKHLASVNPKKSEVAELPPDTPVTFVPLEGFGTSGEIEESETTSLEEVYQGYTYFREGDIAIAKITPSFENGKGAICDGLENEIGFGTTELHVLRPRARENTNTRFLWYVLRSKPFMDEAETSMRGVAGQKRLKSEFVETYQVRELPPDEQRAIADFLDHRTARIDALVAKQKHLVELFTERQNSIVTTAVCKGIESERSLKPSGIEEVGKIPRNWDTRKVKWLLQKSPENGISPPIASESEGIPTFSISTVGGGEVSIMEDLKYVDISQEKARNYSVSEGDVLMIRGNGNPELVGKCGIVTPPVPDGCIYPDILIKIKFRPQLSARFFVYLLNSPAIRPQIEIGAKTSTGLWKVSQSTVSNIRVPCPPVDEQEDIVEHIESASSELDRVTRKTQQSIDLLEEKRQALITAAVTGQIDVTDEREEPHDAHE